MPFQEIFLNLRGSKIQMLKGGSGDPLLYLHSAGGEVTWLPFFEMLSQHYMVYLPAHPGFSQSEGLDKIDSMEDLVFHYTDLMDHLDLTQPYVAGLSLGGWLAAELATRYANRVRKLALLNPVGLFVPDVPSPEVLENTLKAREATARVGWNPYLCNPKLRERLYRITTPTLIIWGESDRLVPPTHGKAYQEGIAGSKLVILEKCGHAPPFEKPQETAKLLSDFFRN